MFHASVDVIRKLIKDRVTMLMKVYDNKQYDSQQDACNAAFHDAVLKDMRSEEVKALEAAIDPSNTLCLTSTSIVCDAHICITIIY